MNVELSSVALKLINDLFRTGLWGASPEETVRRLIEEKLRELSSPNGHGEPRREGSA